MKENSNKNITIAKRLTVALTLILFLSMCVSSVPTRAQSTGSIVINPDGSVTGTNSIEQVGNTYTLMANIAGDIHVERSNIVINGAGYWLNGNGGVGITLNDQNSYPTISVTNVTIKNLYITNCLDGIYSDGGSNNTFYNDEFCNCGYEQGGVTVLMMDCSYNNISYCTFDSESQISIDYSANFNTVTECNLPPNGILIWLSGNETVDRNYWSDYSTKYPNATEVDHSGVENTPYVYLTLPSGAQPAVFEDNQPLMKPITIPLTISNAQANIPEFPAVAILVIFLGLSLFAVTALTIRKRKTNKN